MGNNDIKMGKRMFDLTTNERIAKLETTTEGFNLITEKVHGLREDVAVLGDRFSGIKQLLKDLSDKAEEIRKWQLENLDRVKNVDKISADMKNVEFRIESVSDNISKDIMEMGIVTEKMSRAVDKICDDFNTIQQTLDKRSHLDTWTEKAIIRSSWWGGLFSSIAGKVVTTLITLALGGVGFLILTHYGCGTKDNDTHLEKPSILPSLLP